MTKGTLRHTSGLEIPNVERTSTKSSDRSFGARLVPSTTTPNYFYEDEGWTFVPDEPELPEGEGYAVIGGGYYPLVYVDGQWRQTNMSPRTLAKEVVLARLRQPDVRLYDDDGKDITPNLKEEA